MNQFPNTEWFQHFSSFLENDDEFKTHGRWFTSVLGLRVDQTSHHLLIDRGMVLEVLPGIGDSEILISGSQSQWQVLFNTDWALNRLYRSGTLQIRANEIELMRNWKVIFHICQAMKKNGPGTTGKKTRKGGQ
jgi:hypothetical protein